MHHYTSVLTETICRQIQILKPSNWHNKKSSEEKEETMRRIVSESDSVFGNIE